MEPIKRSRTINLGGGQIVPYPEPGSEFATKIGSNDAGATLRNLLAEQADPDADHFDLGVPLVVVMKQHTHLGNLIALLSEIPDLDRICALIVDDEAHMHSPNVASDGLESATYARITQLRRCLPVHTLLQYTATPQAPLLASIADELSPQFVCLLEPGDGYTGGQYFFLDHHDLFVRGISDDELYALDADQFSDHGPPASLRRAFLTYVVTCAIARARRELDPPHSSMLVHPHSRRDVHKAWLRALQTMQRDVLALLETTGEPDRDELIETDLADAWSELSRSDPELPALDDALLAHVRTVLQRLQIRSINSDGASDVPWPNAPYWVLVGGNLLGVGLTVEGLRTTHMMRSTGVRLADTIQQRARFFGYKGQYSNLCRAWLQPELDAAFVDYVKHEKALRGSLAEIERDQRPLREWKRVFLLDPNFKLTRRAAQRITLDQFRLDREGWCLQQHVDRDELAILGTNRALLDEFTAGRAFARAAEISGDTPATGHEVASCSLEELRTLLAELHLLGVDSHRFTALSVLLANLADDGVYDEGCVVVDIARSMKPARRNRAVYWVAKDPHIGTLTLHQGRNPSEGEPRYAGDAHARDDDRITVQLHRLDLRDGANGPPVSGGDDLPFVAVYLPPELRTGIHLES
jgi:hypothetical protein